LFVEISHGHKSVVIAVELIAHIDGRWWEVVAGSIRGNDIGRVGWIDGKLIEDCLLRLFIILFDEEV
jgi:hypothetical protein